MPPRGGRARPATGRPPKKTTSDNNTTEAGPSTIKPEPTPTSATATATALEPTPTLTLAAEPVKPKLASSASAPKTRFRPRAIRRGEAERRELAEEETKKQLQHAQQEERQLRRSNRGRGRGRSGRGAMMGGRGRGGGLGFNGAKQSYGGGGGSNSKTEYDHIAAMPDDRVNADQLHKLSLDDDITSTSGSKAMRAASQTTGIMPIGLLREPHREKQLVVSTTAEQDASAARNIINDSSSGDEGDTITSEEHALAVEMAKKDTGRWAGAPTGDVPMVRLEDGTVRPMNIDEAIRIQGQKDDAQQAGEGVTLASAPAAAEKPKPPQPKVKDILELEHEAMMENLATLLSELGPDPGRDDGEPMNKDGRVYMLQLPPIMPQLGKVEKPNPVKSEPLDDDNDIEMTGTESLPQSTPAPVNPKDLPGRGPLTTETGYVGKMIVRKSGKTELDWGGMKMEVGTGIRTDFVTTAVIMETDDVKNQGQIMGRAVSMGKIMGKFIAVPVFSEEEEWDEE